MQNTETQQQDVEVARGSIFYDNVCTTTVDKNGVTVKTETQHKLVKHVIVNAVLRLSILNILLNLILIAGEVFISIDLNVPESQHLLNTSYVITSGLYFMTIGLLSSIIVTQTNKKLFQFILITQFFGIFIATRLTIIHVELMRSGIISKIIEAEKKLKHRSYFDLLFRYVVNYILAHGAFSTLLCILFVIVFFQIIMQSR